MKILAVCGSLRPSSFTRLALDVAVEGIKKAGGEPVTLDLMNPVLPFMCEGVTETDPAVVALKAAVAGAEGLLIATPVYHDSYSGVLKNALDHLYDELAGKVVALISVGAGRVGHGQALEHLRAVLRETDSWVLPRQVVIPTVRDAFAENKRPKDVEVELRLIQLGQELVLRARLLRPRRGK